MDIIDVLKADHRKAETMLEQLEKTTTRAGKTRTEVLAKVVADLRVHMRFEEEVLYPAVKAGGDGERRELTNEAYAEHESARGAIAKLEALSTDDEMWKAWLSVLKEGITHHIDEEEQADGLFQFAKRSIPSDERKAMAARYAAMKGDGHKPETSMRAGSM
ncbi:MAG: hemerythrin domain-containing protein [Myxococcota bacterium]